MIRHSLRCVIKKHDVSSESGMAEEQESDLRGKGLYEKTARHN